MQIYVRPNLYGKRLKICFIDWKDIVNRTLLFHRQFQASNTFGEDTLLVWIYQNFKPLDKIRCRKKFGFETDEFIILWFGRFSGSLKRIYSVVACVS